MSELILQVCDSCPTMDGSQPDHNGGSHREHRDLLAAGPLLSHSDRGGSLVDNILLCPGSLHISDPGRH